MKEIQEATDLLRGLLKKDQNFVLFLLAPHPEGTRTAYSSSLERSEALRFLVDMVVNMRSRMRAKDSEAPFEARVMGEGLDVIPDVLKVAMFEILEAGMSALGGRVTVGAWRDLLLVFCTGMAHDQGITRADFERCALECAQEEWSTPSTEGRVALDALLEKTKPQGG